MAATMTVTHQTQSGRLADDQVTSDEATYSILMHLTLLAHLVAPVLSAAAPVVMWLLRRKDSPFIDDHGREAVNFHATLLIYWVLALLVTIFTLGLGVVLFVVPYVLGVIGMIMASKAAYRGEYFRYPATIRFLH
jgi:hypothetical protein